ncbi:basic-leucine zipper transcription factor A [Eurosta solidaginis]|uniref:basic-leucine zipper transcription factor A n=1 Tax=Eurosta solidaginis TaxID=178769 RepID=UPI0035306CAC
MSEEHQQEKQQQQQQQMTQQQQHQRQQHMQQQHKCSKDTTTGNSCSSSSSSPTNTASTTTPRKSNIHEMCNQEFVSRLMAATPPYLYSTPVGTNNFFFSDMLRSLVQARNNETARNLQLQQSMVLARRPRKRTWVHHHRPYYEHLRERKEAEEKQQQQQQMQQQQQLTGNAVSAVGGLEKPLELTNKPYFHLANKYRKLDDATTAKDGGTDIKLGRCHTGGVTTPNSSAASATNGSSNGGGAADAVLQDTPPAASLPPQDLVLPPPPPVWYPPLYPPYGIDPLHFFIDLRVSGHIYDRKKGNISPLTSADNSNAPNDSESIEGNASSASLLNKHRQGSAFTVPVPRANDSKSAAAHTLDAINLTSSAMASKFENYTKYYDMGEAKENQPLRKSSATYMLQHLPRLYSQFAARDLIASNAAADVDGSHNLDSDNKSEPDCDADSDGRASVDNSVSLCGNNRERDIDVEIIDSIKYRTDGESSRCSSADDASITQID